MKLVEALMVTTGSTEQIIEATTNVENILAVENTFLFILAAILIAILIVFANRINKLEDAIKNINERFDELSGTLLEISKRPCQITDTLGYSVHMTKSKDTLDNSIVIYPKEENTENKTEE